MSEPYVGQIIMVGFGFAPRGWAFCDGQLMAISQNDALFSLLGCTYGGDCRTTFALPDLRGRIPIHVGQGPGLSNYRWAEKGGIENVTLTTAQMPSHRHSPMAIDDVANSFTPQNSLWAKEATSASINYSTQMPNVPMKLNLSGISGGGQSHTNLAPFLSVYFCIALFGVYPSRS